MDSQPIPKKRYFSTRPDTLDFRDQRYRPSLVRVPARITVQDYEMRFAGHPIHILDQKESGHCTGFALAAVINCLRQLRQGEECATEPVSPHMLFAMARRYDSWQGEAYEWASARGAMKGWHKHGVCRLKEWGPDTPPPGNLLPPPVREDASRTPLGSYYRVNHKDLVEMHSALAEVGVLLATAQIHPGWGGGPGLDGPDPATGLINYTPARRSGGSEAIEEQQQEQFSGIDVCHAFAIVGYDDRGFWIQNSWGTAWGKKGFGLLSYDDWLLNGRDVWVAQLGAPVRVNLRGDESTTSLHEISASEVTKSLVLADLRPHIVSYCNHGGPQETGTYGNSRDAVRQLLLKSAEGAVPPLPSSYLDPYLNRKAPLRLLLYAPEGLEDGHQAARSLLPVLPTLLHEEVNIYPLLLNRRSGLGTPLLSQLQLAYEQRQPDSGADKDAVLPSVRERLPDTLEALVRTRGELLWQEWKKAAWRLFWAEDQEDSCENELLREQRASLPEPVEPLPPLPAKNGRPATTDPRQLGCYGIGYDLLLRLQELREAASKAELHLLGHGVGSLAIVRLVQTLLKDAEQGKSTQRFSLLHPMSITLWAPACSLALLNNTVGEYVRRHPACRFTLFTLTPEAEAKDQVGPYYRRSLLHLVARSLDRHEAGALKLAGLTRDLLPYRHPHADRATGQQLCFGMSVGVSARAAPAKASWLVAPTPENLPQQLRSDASTHRGFATDPATWAATCARILNIRDTPGKRDFFADRFDFRALQTATAKMPSASSLPHLPSFHFPSHGFSFA
ncbi:C1 family peptidase [Hymenobacter fodinae]|uniref:Peptidase C1A papain C-terminal domain-containing protein n=1 Tax=Hymenobacter fodinae TaxID=2510796 RepID=A0A4Z0NZ68_9BACT|nr:C1 family peptidase [Hymenobacter fodinae]TGE03841.1 hypothetical protein EU556_24860 [Hymenobacter fodinae]